MSFVVENLPGAIREAKNKLRRRNPNYAETFAEVGAEIKRQVLEVVEERDSGGEVIPIVACALLQAVTSIPVAEPGDAVFWHPDCVHAVENEHTGNGWSNVMYIGATAGCEKNWAYVSQQLPKFLEGRTPPNFAPDDYEVDFVGPATVGDLRRRAGVRWGWSSVI